MITSGKDVTVVEIASHFVVTNVPLIILLKYTICDCITEAVDECVQARFSGVSLPTSNHMEIEEALRVCRSIKTILSRKSLSSSVL